MKASPRINLYYKIMLNISDYMQGRNSAYWKHLVVLMISVLMLLNLLSIVVLINRWLMPAKLMFLDYHSSFLPGVDKVYLLVAGIIFLGLLVFNYRCFYRNGVYEKLRRDPANRKYNAISSNHYILYLILSFILCLLTS
jgi:hypothetical protein